METRIEYQFIPPRWSEQGSTVPHCERDGHCWHEGTAVGSQYCCRCGKYDYSQCPILELSLLQQQ